MGRRQRRFDKEGIDMMEIERPKIETASLSPDGRYGKFVAEPLERGFGITLGNSLRRVLLSSLPGVAVTSVKIDGVVHEFSTIEGVKEDVTEIVLNLKGIAAKLYTDGPKTVRVEAVGPCEVTADNIKQGDDIEILNPEWHIATLGEGGKLVMELTFDKGRGYVPAERNKQAIVEKNDINTLPVDEAGTLKELVTTFRVTFKEADPNTVTGIELLSSPTKLTYTKGESLNTSGLTLRVKKYSGATEDIEKGFTCEPTVLDTVGTQTITVKYDDKTVTFDVTVTEAVASVPSSVSSSVAPPQPSSSVPESSSEPESVVESEVSSEPESVVEPEPSSEPESVVEPESSEPEAEPVDAPVEEKGGVPFWLWIIIGLGVIAIGAGVALFVIGKKKLDD